MNKVLPWKTADGTKSLADGDLHSLESFPKRGTTRDCMVVRTRLATSQLPMTECEGEPFHSFESLLVLLCNVLRVSRSVGRIEGIDVDEFELGTVSSFPFCDTTHPARSPAEREDNASLTVNVTFCGYSASSAVGEPNNDPWGGTFWSFT